MQPSRENALKFERFIFDVLPLAERWTLVETRRDEEFAPLKNATGADSPESVRQALCNLAAGWLERTGVAVRRNAEGNAWSGWRSARCSRSGCGRIGGEGAKGSAD